MLRKSLTRPLGRCLLPQLKVERVNPIVPRFICSPFTSTKPSTVKPNSRFFSTEKKPSEGVQSSLLESQAASEDALMNAPLTAKEKVQTGFWMAFLAFGAVCFVFTVRELWPSSNSPNNVFDEGKKSFYSSSTPNSHQFFAQHLIKFREMIACVQWSANQ